MFNLSDEQMAFRLLDRHQYFYTQSYGNAPEAVRLLRLRTMHGGPTSMAVVGKSATRL
jgi:hypothetical protein